MANATVDSLYRNMYQSVTLFSFEVQTSLNRSEIYYSKFQPAIYNFTFLNNLTFEKKNFRKNRIFYWKSLGGPIKVIYSIHGIIEVSPPITNTKSVALQDKISIIFPKSLQ